MTNNNSSNKKEHGKEDFGIAVLGGLGCGKTAVVLHKLHEKFEEKQDETIWDTVFLISYCLIVLVSTLPKPL